MGDASGHPDQGRIEATDPLPQALFTESDLDEETLQVRHGLRVLRRHLVSVVLISVLVPLAVVAYDLHFRDHVYSVRLDVDRLDDESLRVLPTPADLTSLREMSLSAIRRLLVSPGMSAFLRERLRGEAEAIRRAAGGQPPEKRADQLALADRLERMSGPTGADTPSAYREFRGGVSVEPAGENALRVELTGAHPDAMRAVAEHIVDGLNALARSSRVERLETFLEKLEASKEKTDAELRELRAEINTLTEQLKREDTGLGGEARRLERLRAEEADLEMEIETHRLRLERAKEAADWPALRERFGIRTLRDIPAVFVDGNPLRQALRKQLRRLEDLTNRYTSEHPRIQQVRRELKLTVRRLQEEGHVTADGRVPPLPTPREEEALRGIHQLVGQLPGLEARLEALRRRRERLSGAIHDASSAERESRRDEQRRARAIMDRIENLQDREAHHRSNSRRIYGLLAETRLILDPVRRERRFASGGAPRVRRESPNLRVDAALGLALGVLLGGLAAFLHESVDHRLHTPFDIYYHLRLNYLGVVPFRTGREPLIISPETPDSNLAEMYAHLRNNIRYGRTGRPEKSLLVVSATQGEGKSTMATNLAISYALEGNNVVLVDADLRRPRSHKLVEILEGATKYTGGLSECLAGEASLQEVVYPTAAAGLSILPAGGRVRNPPKLLNSPATGQVIRTLEEQYEVVIIDCPAILPVVDGTALSPLVRGVLLVVAADEVEIAEVRMALYRLQHVGAPMVGAVLNKVRERLSSYYYGYRYRTGYRTSYDNGKQSGDDTAA